MTALRPVGPFDLECLAALHAACFPDPWSASAMAALLATPGCFGLLSVTADQPSGFLLARVAADEAEILSVGVLPDWRRRGIARQLLADASARVAERGARRIFLEVAADNHAARALYLREGFAQVGRRAGYYRRRNSATDALVLARPAAPGGQDPGPY
jgi:ribosomal-protein-alanine N-acetyltransferase